MDNKFPEDVIQGFSLFNQGSYYEAHESFEAAWRKTKDPSREFCRALLQISGGFYRLHQGKPGAAKKFFNHALKWLATFPDSHRGFNNASLQKNLRKTIKHIEGGEGNIDKIKETLNLPNPGDLWQL